MENGLPSIYTYVIYVHCINAAVLIVVFLWPICWFVCAMLEAMSYHDADVSYIYWANTGLNRGGASISCPVGQKDYEQNMTKA